MSRLAIQCPRCGVTGELAFEGTPRDVVALVCPSCDAALVHYHGQTFRIDEAELRYLRSRGHVTEVRAWIREGLPATSETKSDIPGGVPPRDSIGEIDIVNLRRELETCDSVDDFLKLLG